MLVPSSLIPALPDRAALACFFFMPQNERGNPDEIQHRGFVWVYFLFAAWCAGKTAALLAAAFPAHPRRLAALVATAAVALLLVPLALGRTVPYPDPIEPRLYRTPVPRGLVECALYLRTHAAPGDAFQDTGDDALMVLAALAERPCWLSRHPEFNTWVTDPRRPLRQARAAGLQAFRAAPDARAAATQARTLGFRWYVAAPNDKMAWRDHPAARPVFQARGYLVYDLAPDPPAPDRPDNAPDHG